MSLIDKVSSLASRVATEIKSVRALVNGNQSSLSGLITTDKTHLVAAINETNSKAQDALDANATLSASVHKVFIQQTRPSVAGPWTWWQTDSNGNFVDLIIWDGVS